MQADSGRQWCQAGARVVVVVVVGVVVALVVGVVDVD